MGPTNVALVKLFHADQMLREAITRLEVASKDVRVQERRVHDLTEKHRLVEKKLKELKSRSGVLDVDLRTRDAKIEKLRTQQGNAKNNKEYQTLLIEINTAKVDRGKAEEEALKVVATMEAQQKELTETLALLDQEKARLATMKQSIDEKLRGLQAEIDALKPGRDEAAAIVPHQARDAFEKLAERLDGEAMAPISRPDARREEYVCTACNMDLVVDIYNKLHNRDEIVYCPSCRRILFLPDDLPPTVAIKTKPASARATKKTTRGRTPGIPADPVKQEITKLLLRAAGESARNAIAAGNTPEEFEVYIDSKPFGTFKGQNIENFRRTARFCLQEAGVLREMDVYEKGQGPKALAAAAAAAAATGAPSQAEPGVTNGAEPEPAAAPPVPPSPSSDAPTDASAEPTAGVR